MREFILIRTQLLHALGGGSTSKILKENLKIFDFYAVLFRKLKNQKSAILGPIFLKLFRNLSTGPCLLYKNSPTETLKDINIQDRDWNGCPWQQEFNNPGILITQV